MRILIPPVEHVPLECNSKPVMRTVILCMNQTDVELETFGFHDGESLKVMTAGPQTGQKRSERTSEATPHSITRSNARAFSGFDPLWMEYIVVALG